MKGITQIPVLGSIRYIDRARLERSDDLMERFYEAHAWFRQPFDEPMILLDQIVDVFYLSQFTACEKVSFCFELVERFGRGCVFVHVDHPWLAGMRRSEGFEQELLRRLCVSCRAQEKIERVSLRINCTVEVDPFLFDFDIGLIDAPGIVGRLEVWPAPPFHLGCVALHPAIDRGMIHLQATFEHHLFEIPVTQSVP